MISEGLVVELLFEFGHGDTKYGKGEETKRFFFNREWRLMDANEEGDAGMRWGMRECDF
jgi:hypothetical protein